MRIHIELDDELVAEVDGVSGPGGRNDFMRVAIERAVDQEQRWAALESTAGTLAESTHAWDGDSARWVRDQRQTGEAPDAAVIR